MIRVSNVRAPLGNPDAASLAARQLRIPLSDIAFARLSKQSVDARDKSDVHFVLSIDLELAPGARLPARADARVLPEPEEERVPLAHSEKRPLVVGLGPAGLFAAYELALAGLRPLVLERGKPVDERARDVETFWSGGALDPNSNVQFGEGGAGAFSDGKLNTGIGDKRCAKVLKTLVEFGAPEQILYLAKPHIGTDRLPGVVRALRERIVALGGTVLFRARLTGLEIESGRVTGARFERGGREEIIETERVILAVGHSARDTFEALLRQQVPMQRKPFSIGARIEHKQALVNRAQWGAFAEHPALGAADYKLSCKLPDGRGAYTFCMCPGGFVVAAASEIGMTATNGMSAFARDGENANSALLVDVRPEDFGEGDALAGVRFQRLWEARAYAIGGYCAPAQRVGDFLAGRASSGEGDVQPSYRPGVRYADLSECLPDFAVQGMRCAIERMDRQLRGFASPGALLTGVETRSSSPVRLPRGETGQSEVRGLYPCGEGAGYAGGILSAAVDGLRCADWVIEACR